MLTEHDLNSLMLDIESDRVERTVSVNNTDKFSQAVCAFANDMPNHRQSGFLLIGVKDDGQVSGLIVTDQLLLNLAAIRSNGNILPQPVITVNQYKLDGGEVAVVEVKPSDLPPVRYKGSVWIRVGPSKATANEQEERILSERRVALAKSFDARPCMESSIDDLALGQFDAYRREAVDADVISENHRSIPHQLASLRLYDPSQNKPTHAGLLLVGKDPRAYLPGAYVQYVKFPNLSSVDVPDDQAEISGDLLTVLRELEARLRVLIQTSLQRKTALQERMVSDYPETALRELLMNAVMHRNYDSNSPIRFYVFSDHIEIQSPGGLYGEATPANFPTRNSYRNPIIAEAMKSLGFVNRFGYGVLRAQELLKENGNQPAEFEFDEHTVLVKVYRRPNENSRVF